MSCEPTPVPTDIAGLDQALDRCQLPTTVHDRLAILQHLLNFWHGPIRPQDGMSDAEITSLPMPFSLRWWYRWAGRRTNIMTGQNWLLVPRDFEHRYRMLRVQNGRLVFYVENQGVYQWATLQYGEDPPVFSCLEGRGRWANEGITLPEHLILACLFEAVMCHAKYRASVVWLEEDKLRELIRHVPSLAIRGWRWGNMRFFAGSGAFMNAWENRPGDGEKGLHSVCIGAKISEPLQFSKGVCGREMGTRCALEAQRLPPGATATRNAAIIKRDSDAHFHRPLRWHCVHNIVSHSSQEDMMRGRAIRLPVQRRMVIDFLYFACGVPTVPVQKHMSIPALAAARNACDDRPRWTAIFTKAFALAAEEVPQLRRAYVKLPWPHLYEYPTSKANIIIERDYRGEPALCPVSIKDPAHQPLPVIGGLLQQAATAPLESIKDFQRWKRLTRLPRPLRRLAWWIGLNIGRQRANFFGTFGVSVYSALNAESLHPLSPLTALINYGVITREGDLAVRIMYDHRVMDGATVARALGRMEEILNSVILEEVRALANLPKKYSHSA